MRQNVRGCSPSSHMLSGHFSTFIREHRQWRHVVLRSLKRLSCSSISVAQLLPVFIPRDITVASSIKWAVRQSSFLRVYRVKKSYSAASSLTSEFWLAGCRLPASGILQAFCSQARNSMPLSRQTTYYLQLWLPLQNGLRPSIIVVRFTALNIASVAR